MKKQETSNKLQMKGQTTSNKLRFVVCVLFISLVLVTWLLGFALLAQEELQAKLDVFLQALYYIKNDYVDPKLDDDKLVYGSIRGLLAALDDPYSRFMEPKDYKEMRIRMNGSYGGIGIYIGMRDHQLMVISPIKDTPAYSAGLKARDKIVSINGKSTKDMALEMAVSLIRGPKGSKVKLGILRGKAKEPKDYSIARKEIEIKSLERKVIDNDLAYIKLNTFEKRTAATDMAAALDKAKKEEARGLILDLRNNGGGLLNNAIDIACMFVDNGQNIVSTVDREGRKETYSSPKEPMWTGPMVVLVNDASASASEILAGALRDNHKATLVGIKTFGKASVQNVKTLKDGSAILLTIAKYLTPSGEDISKKGITPEVVVEIPTKEGEEEPMIGEDMPEEKDVQLLKAIEVLKQKLGDYHEGRRHTG